MLELIEAGGWVMWPIMACSVVALAIILERLWALRTARVLPKTLVADLRHWAEQGTLKIMRLEGEDARSPLGQIVAAALASRHHGRETVKEAIEDTGRHVVFELERFLNTLGSIATMAPLLGLLGTVSGMIEILGVVSARGSGEFRLMAGGMSEALVATASGLIVALPALFFYRYFRGRVDELVVYMEREALLLVDLLDERRERGV